MTEDRTVKGILHGVPVTVTIKGNPDYTPTTEEVRNAFSLMDDDAATQENFENFDRWLAEVKAQAWDEGYVSSDDYYGNPDNPYRQGEQQ